MEYTLHPTFVPPTHRVRNRATKFRLDASGWGEFMINATVEQGSGERVSLRHWLRLDGSQERLHEETAGAFRSVFLSSGLADQSILAHIRKALEADASLDVSSNQDLQFIASDEPVEKRIRAEMQRAGSAVFVISERQSPWLAAELDFARKHRIPTMIVRSGRDPSVPTQAMADRVVSLSDSESIEGVAQQIADWAKGLSTDIV